jgi:hypothetical protein
LALDRNHSIAALYSYAFVIKVFFSKAEMIKMWSWPANYSLSFIRFIGVCEGVAVLGLCLPVLMGLLPWVTDVTAICLTVLQLFALRMHLKRHDNVALNLGLIVLSAFVAWAIEVSWACSSARMKPKRRAERTSRFMPAERRADWFT